jgi:hypothetical protein
MTRTIIPPSPRRPFLVVVAALLVVAPFIIVECATSAVVVDALHPPSSSGLAAVVRDDVFVPRERERERERELSSRDPSLDERTAMSFACFVSIVSDYYDDANESEEGEEDGDGTTTTSHPLVWCDVRGLPYGRNVTAEIRDGRCDTFVDVARSEYYDSGIATPHYLPKLSDEEKSMGEFDHAYCCRVDVLSSTFTRDDDDADDGGGTADGNENGGEATSVLSGWHDMDVTYNYREVGGEDVGRNYQGEDDGDVDGQGEMIEEDDDVEKKVSGSMAVEEVLSFVALTDGNARSEKAMGDLDIALGVLAGAVVTMALVAIIYGGDRVKERTNAVSSSMRLRRHERHGRRWADDVRDSNSSVEDDTSRVVEMESTSTTMVPPMRKENEIV